MRISEIKFKPRIKLNHKVRCGCTVRLLALYNNSEGLRISYRPYLVKFQPGGLVFIVSFFVILSLFLVLRKLLIDSCSKMEPIVVC